MAEFSLNISTPEKVFFDGTTDSLVLTTIAGEMGVLGQHVLTVAALETGPLKIKTGDTWRVAAISGGFAEITGTKVVILADTAEWADEIEVGRAQEAKRRAEERVQARRSEMEYLQSQVALKRAITRLRIAGGK
jgi:F-type H+-transporting ATPase subunit epsilon